MPEPAPASSVRTGGTPPGTVEAAGTSHDDWLFGAVAMGVVLADQVTKLWVNAGFGLASAHTAAGGSAAPTPVIGDLVRIAKTYNDGAIFGLLGAAAPILALAGVVIIGAILWYQAHRRGRGGPLVTIALGLILGAAVGNLIDRLRLGHVVDWVDVGIGDLRWYTFNVSDAALSVGLLLLVVAAFVGAPAPEAEGGPIER